MAERGTTYKLEGASGYNALICAIVLSACMDYKRSLRHSKYPVGKTERLRKSCQDKANWILAECKTFFESEWCEYISNINGRTIMDKLDREFAEWEAKKI